MNRDDQETDIGISGAAAEGTSNSGDVDDCFDGKETDKESKKKKNRCVVCRKKVGLTGKKIDFKQKRYKKALTKIVNMKWMFAGFECRCGGLYCSVHRYSDMHNCSFDYREMGAQEIRRNNPVVVGEKVQKIWTI